MGIVKYKKLLGIDVPYSQVKVGYDERGNIAAIISPNGCAVHPRQRITPPIITTMRSTG